MIKMSKKVIQENTLYQEQLEQANVQITTSFYNAELIKVNRMEDERGKEYDRILDTLHNTRKRIALKEALLSLPTIYSTFITILSMAVYGSYCLANGIIKTGQLFAHGLEVISEGGTNLSGGQRQMLAIARAILYRRPVIILDEAFAGIDEQRIDKILDRLKEDIMSTAIIVTHDERVLNKCDLVIEM